MAPTFLFIVLAALVHFTSAASNVPSFRQVRRINIRKQNGRQTSPAPFNCVKAGFYADAKDCNRFYRCVDYYGNEAQFTLFEFVCAEGTIFDESLSVCNHPYAVNPPPACLATTPVITPTVAPPAPVPPAPVPTAPPAPPVVTAAIETTIAPAPVTEQPAVTDLPTPSTAPTAAPTAPTVPPTDAPTAPPTAPTVPPTDAPTAAPTAPTSAPTAPTVPPTDAPTAPPTAPTVPPTDAPTAAPTEAPTVAPTAPTAAPTEAPTAAPTEAPTVAPTAPTVPTTESSAEITFAPDVLPVDPVTTTAAPVPEPTTASPAQATTVTAPATTVSDGETEVSPAKPIVPPPTAAAPFMLTCNDDKFHRHPVRCDLYYKCVWTDLAFSVDLRACPAGLNYDEASDTCRSPGRTTACVFATLPPAGVATTVTTTTVATEAPAAVPTTTVATEAPVTAPATAPPVVETTATTAPSVPAQYTLAPGSLYDCKQPGHYPYQLDCIRFYRCFEIEPNVLKGLLYRCPVDYAYSTVTERCVRQNTLPACDRNGIRLPMDFPVPLIPLEDTTTVLLEDFDSFFGNPNYFYIPRRKIKNNPQSSRIKNNPQSKIKRY